MNRIEPVPVLALALALGLSLVAACAVDPSAPASGPPKRTSGPEPAARLVVLAGTVGSMRLLTPGSDGQLEPFGTSPAPADAAWLSSAAGQLLVTTLTGRALLSAGASGGAWRAGPGDLGRSHPLRAFGMLDPAGRRIAFVDGDPGSGEAGRLVTANLDGGAGPSLHLDRAAESAPAWLPDGRLVVVVRDAFDEPRPVLADPGVGSSTSLSSAPLRSIAISSQAVAIITDGGALEFGSLVDWLAGRALKQIPSPGATGSAEVLQAQPSGDGLELALVIDDANGDATAVRIVTPDGGREFARLVLPRGANRAIVAWLGAP
ncbi:MAG TPA: hypothetical protein VIB99_01870 [Candidatus Limnocylindrales bacterium]